MVVAMLNDGAGMNYPMVNNKKSCFKNVLYEVLSVKLGVERIQYYYKTAFYFSYLLYFFTIA